MKTAFLLSLSVLVVLMTTVVGVSADDAASGSPAPVAQADTEMLSQLNTAPTFSDSTLRRPF